MRNKKIILVFALIIGIIHIGYSVYNPEGHDYKVYSERMTGSFISDLPISWCLMKLFSSILGNPNGLYVLSFISCIVFYSLYALKIKNEDVLIIFSFGFFWLYPVWYMSKGVLRNLIGLCLISYFILYRNKKHSIYEALILSMTHIPTLMIYAFYNLSKKKYKNTFYSIISLFLMLSIGLILKGPILESTIKPLRMIGVKLLNPFNYFPFIFKGPQVLTYSIIVISFYIYAYFTKFMRNYDSGLIFWLIMLVIPFIPIYVYKVQYRFLLFSILPICMFIIYENEHETKFQKLYLSLISIISLSLRIIAGL